jgi:hypothetical protein
LECYLKPVKDPSQRDRWARLRFSIIGPLLAAPPEAGKLHSALELLAAKTWHHPATGLDVTFGLNIRDWFAQQELGFEVLHTSGHADVKTLVELARSVAAKRVIPIHTDSPERLGELIEGATPVHDGEWIKV